MRLPLSNNKFATIISTYAPTMNYPEPEKEEYYRSLSDVVGRVPAADKLVILGDFNARVGGDHDMSCMGQRLESSERAAAIRMAKFYSIFARSSDLWLQILTSTNWITTTIPGNTLDLRNFIFSITS